MTTVWKQLAAALLLCLALLGGPDNAYAQEAYANPNPTVEAGWEVPARPDHWTTIHGSFTRFHGEPRDTKLLLAMAEHANKRLPELALQLGVPIGDTIHIHLAPSAQQFHDMQPGNAPSWADGVAYPALGLIYLHAPRARNNTGKPLHQVLDHELVHIILGRAFYPHPTPQWIQEGVAQVWANEFTPETTNQLAKGMLGTGLLSLNALDSGFPSDPVRAQLAYAQSADLISHLDAHYGEGTVKTIIARMVAGDTLDGAMYKATGEYLEEVDETWRDRLAGAIPLEWTALMGENTWWVLGAGILAIAGVMRRRQFNRRLEEMGAEEALVDELMARIKADEQERAVAEEWRATNGAGPH